MSYGVSGAGLRRAGIGGLAALMCAGLALTASPAQADFAPTDGLIGIADSATSTAGTQGATTVVPGATAQPLDDVVLAIPNSWHTGDSITLQLYDRGVTGTATPAKMTTTTRLVLNGTPTVSVSALPSNPAGLTAPTFGTPATAASARVAVSTDRDKVVLTTTNSSVAGTGTFLVKVSGLKVDTGPEVAPGEIRVVPFATNKGSIPLLDPDKPSPVFAGNKPGTINLYTVPGYVAPASIAVASPAGVTANGTTQTVGDLTITELSPRGLQAGTYRVDVAGATIRNTAATPVTVKVTGATGESAAATATVSGSSLQFQLTQSDVAAANANKASIVLHGVQLSATTNGKITYALSGGSVSQYYATAGQSPAITGAAPAIGADSAFGTAGSKASQADIVPPGITASGKAIGANARIGGADRYATAALAALQNNARHHNGATAIVASGVAFPDALSAGFLSQRLNGASVLLTTPASLPAATTNALRQMKTTKVYVIGGTAVVSAAVVKSLQTVVNANVGTGAGQVTRLAGADRYATNQAVNAQAISISPTIGTTTVTFGQTAPKRTALLASGEAFADALSAAPAIAGANDPIPLVLTPGSGLNQLARVQLGGLGITQVIVIGGDVAISPAVVNELTGKGVAVKRLAGADRYETAAKVADFERAATTPASATVDGGLGFNGTEAFLASGAGYADALAGGPLAANQRSSMLLTSGTALSAPAATWLSANKANLDQVTALGLQASISDAVLAAAQSAIS
jgi:putative cell wall-binding protein